MSGAEHVETIDVMATVIAVESFCDAVGLPRHALPAPIASEPRRQPPAAGWREVLQSRHDTGGTNAQRWLRLLWHVLVQ